MFEKVTEHRHTDILPKGCLAPGTATLLQRQFSMFKNGDSISCKMK